MKYLPALLLILLMTACQEKDFSPTPAKYDYALVIHGGAGTILKKNMTDDQETAYLEAMNAALDIGEAILKEGGQSVDAVEQVIQYLEDSELFNAGKGAVFTNAGRNEHDASIMEGETQNAGAVGGTTIVRHPISAARAVMERSEHVMLTGSGADEFAIQQGLDTVDNEYFYTEGRWQSLQRVKQAETNEEPTTEDDKHGTVGCVALDKSGNIVAGTSTGGMTNKRYNRIGDSPIIGAGTYADNTTCGVSCTGHGEYFIRYAVAHEVSSRMRHLGESVLDAASHVVNQLLVEKKGSGGLIALDANGQIAMPFNTEGMYRGYARPNERVVEIYK